MKKVSTLFILLFIIVCNPSFAQFNIDAQIRNRFEVRDGYQKLSAKEDIPAAFMFQQTRVALRYNSENLKVTITPQDARVWGDEKLSNATGVYGDDASLSLFEGFAEIKLINKNDIWLSIGRQQLNYDSQRLLSARNWNINGIAYNAAILKITNPLWNLHIGSSWNSTGASKSNNYYPPNRIKSLNYAWLNRQISDDLKISLMHISSGVTPSDTTNQLNFRHTFGLYTKYQNNNLHIWSNAYYQFGKNQSGVSVSAFLFDADAGYKIGNLTPGIGISYLSGNKTIGSTQTTDHLFDVLYGARHGYFGLIDYFSNFSIDTKEGGLTDLYYYLKLKLSNKISVNNTGHCFLLAQLNELTPGEKVLGYENDLVLSYRFNKWGNFEAGYMFMLPAESLRTMHNINDSYFSQFLYLQLTIILN